VPHPVPDLVLLPSQQNSIERTRDSAQKRFEDTSQNVARCHRKFLRPKSLCLCWPCSTDCSVCQWAPDPSTSQTRACRTKRAQQHFFIIAMLLPCQSCTSQGVIDIECHCTVHMEKVTISDDGILPPLFFTKSESCCFYILSVCHLCQSYCCLQAHSGLNRLPAVPVSVQFQFSSISFF